MEPYVHPNYEKPPILEAVIQLEFGDQLDEAGLKRAADAVPAEYSSRKGETGFQIKMTATGPVHEAIGKGWRLSDVGAQKVVVLRPSVIAVARLAPYPGWDTFFSDAWDVFCRVRTKVGYRKVSSVALRYVNRLDIPNDRVSAGYGDFVNVGLPAALPELGSSKAFLTQADYYPVEGPADRVILRTATAEPALISHASLILDLDVMSNKEVPQTEVDLQKLMHKLRETKNRIFQACITSQAEALFKAR